MSNQKLRFATVCSGVEAVSLAWEPLGMTPVFYSEIEAFPKAVLAHRWPDVPDLGDLTAIRGEDWKGKVDIFWGSTPCQAFSAAGAKDGMSDPRGALTLSFVDIADKMDPDFIVWENVKGVFSDKQNAFGHFLAALAGEDGPLEPPGGKWTNAGYVLGPRRTVAWRVFNAQHSGVPQRRHRVFLVACPVGGADPREILFESDGPRRDSPPSPEAEQKDTFDPLESFTASALSNVCYVNTDAYTKTSLTTAYPLKADQGSGGRGSVALAVLRDGTWEADVRRLMPIECERLQGIPPCTNEINISCYVDQQNSNATVEILSHKSQKHAWRAAENVWSEHAHNAVTSLNSNHQNHALPVVLSVHICLEARRVQIRNLKESKSSANSAVMLDCILPQESIANFAQINALLMQRKEKTTDSGAEELLPIATLSFDPQNGNRPVEKFGHGTKDRVSDVVPSTREKSPCSMFTIEQHGPNTQNFDCLMTTLCSSALDVIAGFIPKATSKSNIYEVELAISSGHTMIPWDGKPADKCPDTLRWRTLGNSLNVLDARWIGERILASRQPPVRFWDDLPNSILLEDCYVAGCNNRTCGGGTQDGIAITLCPQHRTREGLAAGIAAYRSWK